jgi:glycosyltransferase involved in cell wall biosynthesis
MVISTRKRDERPSNIASVVMLTADRKIDRRILLQADSLEAAGWRVTIIGMALDPSDVDTDPRIVRIGGENPIEKRCEFVLHAYRWLRQCLSMNNWLMRAVKSAAWRYAVDQEAFYLKLFSKTAARFSPDVFVAHDLPMLPVAHFACQSCSTKLVYDSHELYSEQEFSMREKQRWVEIEAKYIGGCDAVITINPSIARELERRYGIEDVNVIYNADRTVDLPINRHLFHRAFGMDPKQKILLFQGGLSAGRNLEVLVEAMQLVQNPNLNLVILGDGQLGISLRKKVTALKLAARVHLHPAVPQSELVAFSSSADAGIIPYQATCLNNYYCTPNKLFEFIAAGLPILASDLPELRRMVQSQDIGLTGGMSSPETTAQLIDEFFSDDHRLTRWQQRVAEARKIVCWENEGEKLVGIFEALL